MSSNSAKDFEKYARECVKLAKQPNTPPGLVTKERIGSEKRTATGQSACRLCEHPSVMQR